MSSSAFIFHASEGTTYPSVRGQISRHTCKQMSNDKLFHRSFCVAPHVRSTAKSCTETQALLSPRPILFYHHRHVKTNSASLKYTMHVWSSALQNFNPHRLISRFADNTPSSELTFVQKKRMAGSVATRILIRAKLIHYS